MTENTLELSPYLIGTFKQTSEHVIVKNKFDNTDFCKIGMADSSQLEEAISKGLSTEKIMAKLSSFERAEILLSIANQLKENIEHFARIIAIEAGKPIKYARIEAERASQTFYIAAEECKRINSELLSLDWYPNGKGREGIIKHFPVGLVAGITPFNFPLNLVAHKVAPAIAAGCPMILKPATTTPVSALELAKIIDNTSLPKGAFSVVTMNHDVSKPLISDDRIKKISFTGSPEVGWKMKNDCGKKRITLELGGNAGAIVSETANLDEAVPKCVTGAFAYSGQICIHTQRLYVHQSLYENFVERFIEKTKTLKFGDPISENADISVLIDEKNAIRVEQWIKEAVEQGAKLEIGGQRKGSFIEPTVLTNTNPSMRVWKDEVFGPVVIIEPYENFEDAIKMVNDSVFGLQAGVFTNNINEMNTAFSELEVGGVMINEVPTFRIDHAPYGGIKNSGFGREGLKYAIQEMSNLKIMIKPV